jgi:hypothetical protein
MAPGCETLRVIIQFKPELNAEMVVIFKGNYRQYEEAGVIFVVIFGLIHICSGKGELLNLVKLYRVICTNSIITWTHNEKTPVTVTFQRITVTYFRQVSMKCN